MKRLREANIYAQVAERKAQDSKERTSIHHAAIAVMSFGT
jgi:hypothetical protein